jgi:hypothetical protein
MCSAASSIRTTAGTRRRSRISGGPRNWETRCASVSTSECCITAWVISPPPAAISTPGCSASRTTPPAWNTGRGCAATPAITTGRSRTSGAYSPCSATAESRGLPFRGADARVAWRGGGRRGARACSIRPTRSSVITPQVQRKAIALELRLGQPDRAIERLRALEPTLGNSPDWKVEMGELLLSAGRGEQAQAWFRKAADQLQGLRPTPARQQLMRRVQAHLDATATGRSVPTAPVLPSPQHDG